MDHVFISHIPEDAEQAEQLHGMLKAAGVTVWRESSSLQPGQFKELAIRTAIEQASAFVVCFSGHTQSRAPSHQYAELVLAVERARRRPPGEQWIFPVRFSDCRLPEYELGSGYNLNSLQKVDLFCQPWQPAVSLLVAAIRTAQGFPDAMTFGSGAVSPEVGADLSLDVEYEWRPYLASQFGASELPERWTFGELDKLRLAEIARNPGGSRTTDVLTALCLAVKAKPVFLALDRDDELGIGHLQVIYQREVGSWPDGRNADALLVDAANVMVAERHSRQDQELWALARFVVGVAAVLGVSPRQDEQLARWIESLGLRLKDAAAYYAPRSEQQFWLYLGLGTEPGPWPEKVDWMLLSKNSDSDVIGKPVACAPTADGLKRALGEVVNSVQPVATNLVVDLAVPRALMDESIENWPLVEVDGQLEPLSARHQPRLRWSERRRNRLLEGLHRDRAERTAPYWGGRVMRWLCADPLQPVPCFIAGGEPMAHKDLLRALLRKGCGFVIWFPAGAGKSTATKISKAAWKMRGPARRLALPEHLPAFDQQQPAVIWDDPNGRGLISLPPWVAPESP